MMNRLICFDLETTGTNPSTDRIIEIYAEEVHGNASFYSRINPVVAIPQEVSELTGIVDADLVGCPRFSDIAHGLLDFLSGADLLGFNIRGFDIPMLVEEFERVGISYDLADVRILDACAIYKKYNRRTLGSAIEKYLGVERLDAHTALADTRYTIDVWAAMLKAHDLEGKSRDELAAECQPIVDGFLAVDLAGKLGKDSRGLVCWTFGKNKGCPVIDDLGYADWVLKSDFPAETKRQLRKVLQW